jgi:hypothetical protein
MIQRGARRTAVTGPEFKDGSNPNDPEGIARLIELLEFEIDRIRAEESQPGWTPWALMGSLATALWLLLAELETHIIDFQNVLFLLLALSLAYDCVKFLPSVWQASSRSASRFRLAHGVMSPMRSGALIEVGRSAVLIVATTGIRPLLNVRYIIATYLSFGILAFFGMIVFIYSFLKTPLPVGNNRRGMAIGCALFLLPAMFAIFGYAEALLRQMVLPTVPEYRVGGLLLIATIVLLILTKRRSQTPLLETLVGIRHNLALEQIDLDSARRQTEIALLGMKVDDVLQNDLKELLADLEQMSIHVESMTREHQAIVTAAGEYGGKTGEDQCASIKDWIASAEGQIKSMEDWIVSAEDPVAAIENWMASVEAQMASIQELAASEEAQITLLETLDQSTDAHLDELGELLERFIDKNARFRRRALALATMSGDSIDEIVAVQDRIRAALGEYQSRHKHLNEQRKGIRELRHRLNERNKAYMDLMDQVTQITEERSEAIRELLEGTTDQGGYESSKGLMVGR